MEQHFIDAVSGVRLVGGEVMTGELADQTRPGAIAHLLQQTIGASHPDSALLLGAGAATLVQDLPHALPVDLVLRSLPDARDLVSNTRDRTALTVHAGGLDRFSPGRRWPLVVCLGGPEELLTPDSTPMGHAAFLAAVADLLAPGGTAILAVANEIGLDEVFRLDVRSHLDADSSWYRGSDGYDSRRMLHHELVPALTGAGLSAEATWCAFPNFAAPSLLVAPSACAEPAVRPHLEGLIARAEGARFSTTPAVVDTYRTTRRLLEADLALQTAPGWLLVARRSEDTTAVEQASEASTGASAASSVPAETNWPAVLTSEDRTRPEWASVTTLTQGTDGWSTQVVSRGNHTLMERRVHRDLDAGSHSPHGGELLENLMRTEAARGNLAGLRRLVQAYGRFLNGADFSGAAAGRSFFAVPSNVVVHEDSMSVLDPTWTWAEELPEALPLARGLRDFSRRMLAAGAEHPWQADISPDAVTQTLLAMVSLPWSDALVAEIAEREAELEIVLHGGGAIEQSAALAANLAGGASQFVSAPSPARGYRESLAATGRLSQELHERSGQVKWLEATVRQRDHRVAQLQMQVERIEGSPSYKLGRVVTAPTRRVSDRAMRKVKSRVLTFLPPRYSRGAERAFERAGL